MASPTRPSVKKYSFGANHSEDRYGVPENVLEVEVGQLNQKSHFVYLSQPRTGQGSTNKRRKQQQICRLRNILQGLREAVVLI